MKILWVKAGKILPVDTGGKIRSYNLLRHLAARHEVALLTYYGGERDELYEREIDERLPGALTVHTAAPESASLARKLSYLRRLPARAPFAVTSFTSPKVRRLVAELMNARRFDVVVCDFLAASLNFPRELRTPCVLFQHNVESALWQRKAEHPANIAERVVFGLEAAKMSAYERATVRRFQHVIAVSQHDRELMSAMTDSTRISVVPTGVDLSHYRTVLTDANDNAGDFVSDARARADKPLVLFLGSMDWEPNVDGVDYFCREIWSKVLAAVPNARFRIVGRDPRPRVLRLASDSVEVTGTVPSVVEHLREATVFVVPLRVGGGTRLKIFEAMAAGKAVVSTTIGAEGLDVRHGRDLLLADDAETFAASVVALLKDEAQRRRLERAASELAARYDWAVITERFEEVLARVVADTDAASELASVPASASL